MALKIITNFPEKASTVNAVSLQDAYGIFPADFDPSFLGYEAPIGSLILRDNDGTPELWQKKGINDIDWELMPNFQLVSDLQNEVNNIESASGNIFNSDGTYNGALVDATLSSVSSSTNLLNALSQIDTYVTSGSIFGTQYYYAESIGVSKTNSLSFMEKLKLTTGSIPAGNYRIGWSFEFNHSSRNSNFLGRVYLDDVTELASYVIRPSDASGNFQNTGSRQKYLASGFKHINLSAGVHFIDIDFATDDNNINSSIWNTNIEFWRIN